VSADIHIIITTMHTLGAVIHVMTTTIHPLSTVIHIIFVTPAFACVRHTQEDYPIHLQLKLLSRAADPVTRCCISKLCIDSRGSHKDLFSPEKEAHDVVDDTQDSHCPLPAIPHDPQVVHYHHRVHGGYGDCCRRGIPVRGRGGDNSVIMTFGRG
jgi:hypothetical protein